MAKAKTKTEVESADWHDPAESGINKLSFLKAEPGQVTRIKLMAKPHREYCSYIEQHKIGWIITLTEFEIKNGKYREVQPGLDQTATGKPPEARYIVPVIVYETKKDGTFGKVKPSEIEYTFMLWTMSLNIYDRLFAQWKAWGDDLFNHDLLLTGVKKGTFQFFSDISPAKDAACLHSSVKEQVEADYASYKFAKTFRERAGRKYTEAELTKLLNGEKLNEDND